jgi:glycosyltransferase involved in cell wall biosynthesis
VRVAVSIVIPAYNEEQRLPATIEAVIGWLAKAGLEPAQVIVVDDGSQDRTAAVVEDYARRYPCLRLLRNPGNRGKGYSVRHGMLEAEGEWVLFSDADLSAPIEEFDKLHRAAMDQRAAVAIGSRALDRSLIGVHQSVFREYAGRFFNLLMRLLTGLPFWDTQCGFKLFRGDAAKEVFRRQQLTGFGFDVEALFIARLRGYKIVEVPVRWNHCEGTKVRMLRDSANMFLDLVRVRRFQLDGKYK